MDSCSYIKLLSNPNFPFSDTINFIHTCVKLKTIIQNIKTEQLFNYCMKVIIQNQVAESGGDQWEKILGATEEKEVPPL